MKMRKSVAALVVVSALSGCQLLSEQPVQNGPIVSEWANRPVLDELQTVPSESPAMVVAKGGEKEPADHGNDWFTDGFESSFEQSPDSQAKAVSESDDQYAEKESGWSLFAFEEKADSDIDSERISSQVDVEVLSKKKAEVEHLFFDDESDAEPSHSYIAQTSTYILEGTDTYSFMAYEGETYRSVLSRWLNGQGYGVVAWYLDDLQQAMIDVPLKESFHMVNTLDAAVDSLFTRVRNEDVEVEGQLVPKKEQELAFIELRLNAEAKEAVVTSKKMPTTIFHVTSGSLRDNFVRLGEHYGWNVKKDFYLATDYNVKFGYPIVSEEGNVKVGLEKLLAPFSPLRGALVPSVREIYVVQEER